MTTTDTDAMKERIEASAREVMRRSALIADVDLPAHLTAAILPIVAEEVRKAKADVWGEVCEAFAWCIANGPIEDALPHVAEHNPYLATETGDSDEHR